MKTNGHSPHSGSVPVRPLEDFAPEKSFFGPHCHFGGVLKGTSAPVVFMSRADDVATRLNSLAMTLRILEHGSGV